MGDDNKTILKGYFVLGVDEMRTDLDGELKMLHELAGEFAERELKEEREVRDSYPFGPPPDDLLAAALKVGFFSIMLPEEMGGSAHPLSALCLVLREICRIDASLGAAIFTHSLALEIARQAGGTAILDDISSTETSLLETLIAFPSFDNPGETRPAAVAEKRGDGYEISGTVYYLVLGGVASRALLAARTQGNEGNSFFLVDLEQERVSASQPVLSLGLHACPAVDLNLSSARAVLVGEEGKGDLLFEGAVDRMSVAAAAMACGIIQGSFDDALHYCRERVQGGREIVNWSEVRMMLAEMAIKGKVAEMLVERASAAVDGEERGWQLASRSAALHTQRMAYEVTTDGVQLLGGNGYMKDYGQEKRFRDAEQLQALMGFAPLRRLKYIRRIVEGEPAWTG